MFGTDLLVVAAAVVATIAVLWLVFGFVGATLEFVFVDALAEQSLAIRQGFREHVGRGVRLFAFRVVLFGLTAVILGGLALALFWGPITTLLSGGSPAIGGTRIVVSVGLFVLVGVVVGTLAALVHGLTTEFVVPVMLETGCGVLDGWRKLWPTVRAQWKQYLVYVLVALGLRIATTAAAGIVLGIVTIVLAIPFAVVAFLVGLGAVTSGTVSTATAIGLAVVGIAFLVVVVLASAAVYVPVTAFHRYFALLFVGDVDRRFDVLGERRPPIDDGFSLF